MNNIYKYIIIGGGISGVSLARLFQLSGEEGFLVLEASTELGGLCRTKQIGNHILDTGGGHFLCTKYPEVYDFIFGHIPKTEFNYFERVSKIEIDGHEIDYPVESNIWQLPPEVCAKYLISIIQNGEARSLPPPTDFEAWIRWKLGDLVANRYMLPYNRKIWGVAPSEMDIDWLHKIPGLDIREITLACLRRASDRKKMPSHVGFYYPKSGGFQRIFDAIAAPVLPFIQTQTPVTMIEKTGEGFLVNGRFRARNVITTVPWETIKDSPIFDDNARAAIQQLQHNQLVVSLHTASYETKAHWLYQPDERLSHHRSFFIHNFAPHSNPDGFYRETNAKRWTSNTSNLFFKHNDYAYPIPTLGWARSISTVLLHCEPMGLYGLGRWGQWQYFNSDVCIYEAMRLHRKLGLMYTKV